MSAVQSIDTAPTRAELVEEFAHLLGRLKRRVTAGIPHEVQEQMAGATPHQIDALMTLASSESGLNMNEIAKQQNCALSTATALVDRLEKQGLVERHDDPGDRRVVRIVATDQARTFVACAMEGKRGMATKLLEPLNDREVNQLVTLLTKITDESAGGN